MKRLLYSLLGLTATVLHLAAQLEPASGANPPRLTLVGTNRATIQTITQVQALDGRLTLVTNIYPQVNAGALTGTSSSPQQGELAQPPAVVERGPGYKILQTVTRAPAPDGSTILQTNWQAKFTSRLEKELALAGDQTVIIHPPKVVERGAQQKIVQTVIQFVAADGSSTSKTNSYTTFETQEGLAAALAQPPQVLERGPHHKVIGRLVCEPASDGSLTARTSTYTELGTGLSYQDENGQWRDAVPEFELFNDGVIARQTQHRVILAPNPNQKDAVDFLLPDGARLRSRVLGLGYFDPVSGRSAIIAEVQDSQGELSPAKDQVTYPDAFNGVSADLRYTVTKAGLEQDVNLTEQLPWGPEDYGLSPESELEVITEFFPSAEPRISRRVLRQEPDAEKRKAMAEPDRTDDTIHFGSMQIGQGRAFGLWAQPQAGRFGQGPIVSKHWQKVENRTILYEAVPHRELKPLLEKLPPARQSPDRPKQGASLERKLPKAQVAEAPKAATPTAHVGDLRSGAEVQVAEAQGRKAAIRLAREASTKTGVVLDYFIMDTGYPNFTFSEGTYYVESYCVLAGTTTIQGGAVIKLGPNGALYNEAQVACQTSPSSMAVITSKHDDAFGEIIQGSTGNPAGQQANFDLAVYGECNYRADF